MKYFHMFLVLFLFTICVPTVYADEKEIPNTRVKCAQRLGEMLQNGFPMSWEYVQKTQIDGVGVHTFKTEGCCENILYAVASDTYFMEDKSGNISQFTFISFTAGDIICGMAHKID